MSEQKDKCDAHVLNMLDTLKELVKAGKLHAFAIVICEQGKGVCTDYDYVSPGTILALLGGTSVLNHELICEVQESAQRDNIEKTIDTLAAILTSPPKGSMN